MSRLPTRLQPLWPLLKRTHRFVTLLSGVLFRALSPLLGTRGVPRTATTSSHETARAEPEAVTVHPGGPGEEVVRDQPAGEPPDHWVFRRGRMAQVRPRFTLEVRDGRLVGDDAAVVTPGQVLDYEASPYFGIAGWREHPVFLRPRIPREERLPGTVLSLATRGATTNYYHFLYDVVGRYGVFSEALPGTPVDTVVVPHRSGYQQQLLDLVGVPGERVQPRDDVTLAADRLLVPSSPNHELDAPPWVVDWLRRHLPPSPDAADTPRRLYLSRGQRRNTRRYVAEAELLPRLEERGFVVLDPGSLTVQEQIDTFHGAEIVVAPHGAALTNITFCQPGAAVLEMFAPTYVHLGLWTIADAVGLDYRYLVGDGAVPEGAVMAGVLDDVAVPPARVLAAVDALLG